MSKELLKNFEQAGLAHPEYLGESGTQIAIINNRRKMIDVYHSPNYSYMGTSAYLPVEPGIKQAFLEKDVYVNMETGE